jgi:hypothetical protein
MTWGSVEVEVVVTKLVIVEVGALAVVVTDGVEVVFLMIGTVIVGSRDTVLMDFVDLEPYLVKHTSWV